MERLNFMAKPSSIKGIAAINAIALQETQCMFDDSKLLKEVFQDVTQLTLAGR